MAIDRTGKLGLGIDTLQGLIYHGVVADIPAANQFTCPTLAFQGAGKFANSYYVVAFRDVGGAGAAPQGEVRLITAYTTATGIFAHNAFSAALVDGDEVLIISPILYEILTIRGGAETLESLDDELDAMLDLGLGDPDTLLMDGTEQTLYETTGSSFIYEIYPLRIDWTGLNFGAGEDTTIRVYEKVDGTNYRLIYEETFLAAALPVPVVTSHPRNTNTDIILPPFVTKQDYQITAEQAAIGGGWNTLTYTVIDAKRGT